MTNVSTEAKTSQSLPGKSLVIVEKTFKSDKTILSINMDNLSAEPDFVVKKVNGDLITIPGEIAKLISTHGYEMFNEYEKRKTNLRFLENHPTKLDSDIIEVSKGFNDKLVAKNTSTESKFWPGILAWSDSQLKISKELLNPSDIWEGWILTVGKSQVGRAKWNDVKGIKNLIASMKDENKLRATLALLDPKESSILASRIRLLELYRNRELPITAIADVHKFLIDNEFAQFRPARQEGNKKNGILDIFNVMVGAISIPIAVGINLPYSMPVSYSAKEGQEKYTKEELERLNRQGILSKLIEDSPDWHLVDYEDSLVIGRSEILITRISPDMWRDIKLATVNERFIFDEKKLVKF